MFSSKFLLTALGCAGLALACSSSSGPTGGTFGAAGTGTAGTGNSAAGSGNGVAGTGDGTAGTGNGTAGTGTAGVGNGTFSSGLPGSTPLNTVTSGQAMQACNAEAQFYDSSGLNASLCKLTALQSAILTTTLGGNTPTDSDVQMACQSALTDCLASPSTVDCMSAMAPTGTCTATVAEYEACINATPAPFAAAAAGVPSCDTITLASGQAALAGLTGITEPAACVTLDMKCPSSNPMGM